MAVSTGETVEAPVFDVGGDLGLSRAGRHVLEFGHVGLVGVVDPQLAHTIASQKDLDLLFRAGTQLAPGVHVSFHHSSPFRGTPNDAGIIEEPDLAQLRRSVFGAAGKLGFRTGYNRGKHHGGPPEAIDRLVRIDPDARLRREKFDSRIGPAAGFAVLQGAVGLSFGGAHYNAEPGLVVIADKGQTYGFKPTSGAGALLLVLAERRLAEL